MSEERRDISTDDYLEKHNIYLYVEDALCQLLLYKDEQSKVIPSKFLADYFRSVHEGSHTLYRNYSFISATPHNRSCFIRNVWSCFHHIACHRELLSVKEYHSLLCLLCHDFPLEMVQRTARIVLMDDALDCLMAFVDFLYAFQLQFYYEEYISMCKEPYDLLITGAATVFVPSTENWQQSQPGSHYNDDENRQSEGVNSQSFLDALEKVDMKSPKFLSRPQLQHICSELDKVERITFHGLLMALSKNELINQEIGVLPHRDDVVSGPDAPSRD